MKAPALIFLFVPLAVASAAYVMIGSDAIIIIVFIVALAAFHFSPRESVAAAFGFCFLVSSLLFAAGLEQYAFDLAVVSLALLVAALIAALVRCRDSGSGNDFIARRRKGA